MAATNSAANALPFYLVSGGAATGTSTAIDYSVNQPSFPPAGVLLTTIPATPTRSSVLIQNQSANPMTVVFDDSTDGNVSWFVLNAAASAGAGGGFFQDNFFKGRVRIYGTSGSQLAARQE